MKKPLLLSLALIGTLAPPLAPLSHAKLGETLGQLTQRFGATYTPEAQGAASLLHFRTPGRLRADVLLAGGVSVAEIYFSVLPLNKSGHPPEETVQAILKTNVPGARWRVTTRPDDANDEVRETPDGKYVTVLKYRGPQAENAVWIMSVAQATEVQAAVKSLAGASSTGKGSNSGDVSDVPTPSPNQAFQASPKSEQNLKRADARPRKGLPIAILVMHLNSFEDSNAGLVREEPTHEIDTYLNHAYHANTLTPGAKSAFDMLSKSPAPLEQRMLDQAKGNGDLARVTSINQMLTAERMKVALPLLEEAAAKGDPVAASYLASAYYSQHGALPRDLEKAFTFASLAEKAGSATACVIIGDLIVRGDVPPGKTKLTAFAWYEKGLERGSLSALTTLVPLYLTGGMEMRMHEGQERFYASEGPMAAGDESRAYLLARAVRLYDQSNGGGKLGATYVEMATGELAPEEQRKAEAQVDGFYAGLCKVAPLTFRSPNASAPGAPAPSQSEVPATSSSKVPAGGSLTREQWKQRLAQKCPWRPGANLAVAKTDFVQAMGQPAANTKIGPSVYWTYNCADGSITVIVRDDMLNSTGMMIGRVDEE